MTDFDFLAWPTTQKYITQKFGENPDVYESFGLPGHEGIDISAPIGTSYFAVMPGRVIWFSDQRRSGGNSAYGWHVIIDHENGYTTLYAHADPIPVVTVGQWVEDGDAIALSGNTGNTTGPHLHLTVKKDGYKLDGWPDGYKDPFPHLLSLLT